MHSLFKRRPLGRGFFALKKRLPNTKVQMLLRGQNCLVIGIMLMMWSNVCKTAAEAGLMCFVYLMRLMIREI